MRFPFPAVTAAAVIAFGAIFLAQFGWSKPDDLQEASRLYKLGSRAEAQSKLTAFLGQNPKDVRARFLLGVIHTENKRNADAIKIFTDLTEDHPELPEPYNNLAVVHAAQGDYDKARKALELAIRTHPSYAIAHENLGDIYATLASQAYDKALQLDNGNNAARSKLALIKELVPKPIAVAQAKSDSEPPPITPPPPAKEVVKPEPAKPEPPKPEPAKPVVKSNPSDDILKTVHAWAKAWSTNDPDRYLAFYATDFHTPKGEARDKWEAGRRERLSKPKKIEVGVIGPKVKLKGDDRALVVFHQQYRSDALKASSDKTLELVKRGDRWLIQQELIGKK